MARERGKSVVPELIMPSNKAVAYSSSILCTCRLCVRQASHAVIFAPSVATMRTSTRSCGTVRSSYAG